MAAGWRRGPASSNRVFADDRTSARTCAAAAGSTRSSRPAIVDRETILVVDSQGVGGAGSRAA